MFELSNIEIEFELGKRHSIHSIALFYSAGGRWLLHTFLCTCWTGTITETYAVCTRCKRLHELLPKNYAAEGSYDPDIESTKRRRSV